jgi:hypothetical protein
VYIQYLSILKKLLWIYYVLKNCDIMIILLHA